MVSITRLIILHLCLLAANSFAQGLSPSSASIFVFDSASGGFVSPNTSEAEMILNLKNNFNSLNIPIHLRRMPIIIYRGEVTYLPPKESEEAISANELKRNESYETYDSPAKNEIELNQGVPNEY